MAATAGDNDNRHRRPTTMAGAARALVAVVVMVTVAACTSESQTGSGEPPDTAPATVAGAQTPTGSLTEPRPGSDYCEQVGASGAIDEVQLADATDRAAVELAVATAGTALAGITAAAPAEIAADWNVVSDAYGRLFTAYAAAGFDFTKLMTDATGAAVFEELAGAQLRQAAARIEQFTAEACGVELGLGDDGSGSDGGSSGEPAVAAAPGVTEPLADATAAAIGTQLLAEFGIEGTTEQATCLGRAVSEPAASEPDGDGAALDRYRALLDRCGIDGALIPG